MSEEWGPWIDHDGRGCPCVGQMVGLQSIRNLLGEIHTTGPVTALGGISWKWALTGIPANQVQQIIRYRIRKPKGLTILEGLLENLPKEVEVTG